MIHTIYRLSMVAVILLGLMGVAAGGDVPSVGGKPVWYVSDRGVTPQNPQANDTYTVWLTVNNGSAGGAILSRATVTSYPTSDVLLSASPQEEWVTAGASHTFRFVFRRGNTNGGTVYYNVEPIRVR